MVSARYSWTRRVVSVCWRMLQSWQRNWGHRYWIMIGGLGALMYGIFFFSSRRRHTWCSRDWSSDVCSSDLIEHANFNVLLATFAIAYPFVGGLRTVFGTLAAVIFVQAFLIEGLRFLGDWRNLLFGALIDRKSVV